MMIRKIFKNKIVKNASWLIVGKVIQMVISLFVGFLTARYLGPSNYGLINYATAYTAFFMSFCTLGINSILVKELIDNPMREGEILGTTLLLRAVSSILSAFLIIFIVRIIDGDEITTILVVALSSLGLIFNIFETFNYWFQSKLNSKVTAIATLIAYVITAIYKIILLITNKSVGWFAFATSLDYICLGIILFYFYKKNNGQKLKYSYFEAKELLKKSYHFILPSLMVAIYGYTDKFMLKHMMSEVSVGYYSIATSICSMWCFVLSAIIDSMYPTIMESHKKNKVLFEKNNRRLYAIVFYISVIVSIIICLLSEFVIEILYGEQYLPSVMPLRIVTWYTAFSYLGTARNAWIVCEKKQKYLKYIYSASAVSNIILNFLLIPVFGATGAAAASLVTQIITTLIVPYFIKDMRKNTILMLEGIFLKGIK